MFCAAIDLQCCFHFCFFFVPPKCMLKAHSLKTWPEITNYWLDLCVSKTMKKKKRTDKFAFLISIFDRDSFQRDYHSMFIHLIIKLWMQEFCHHWLIAKFMLNAAKKTNCHSVWSIMWYIPRNWCIKWILILQVKRKFDSQSIAIGFVYRQAKQKFCLLFFDWPSAMKEMNSLNMFCLCAPISKPIWRIAFISMVLFNIQKEHE